MSGPIVRRYGFPNFDNIFGKRDLQHGVDAPPAPPPDEAAGPPSPEPKPAESPRPTEGKSPSQSSG